MRGQSKEGTTSYQDGETIARSLDLLQKGKLMPKGRHDSTQGLKGPFTSPVENRKKRSEISDRCWEAIAIIQVKDEVTWTRGGGNGWDQVII